MLLSLRPSPAPARNLVSPNGKFGLLLLGLIFFFSFAAFAGDSTSAQTEKLRKQAAKAMRQGDFVVAENLWREALSDDAAHAPSRLELSYSLYKQRKLVQSYEEAIQVAQPKAPPKKSFSSAETARAWALMGASLLGAGNFPGARDALSYSLGHNPDEPLALASAAMIDFYENRSDDGIEKLRYAVYLEPREPDFLFALAQIAARAEEYKEAANAYERFLRIAPNTDADRRERIEGLIAFLRYLGSRKSLYDPRGARRTAVSCQIVNNRPIVEVRLNNNAEPLKFVLDTGSGMTVLSEETAQRLGIKPVARGGKARAVGGVGKFEIVYGFVSSLDIGEVRVGNVPVYIRKFYQSGDKVDGYLGLAVIAKFLTELDYGQRTFALTRQESKEKNNRKKRFDAPAQTANDIPLRLTSSGFLSSEVKLEGADVALNFVVDTGASVSVLDSAISHALELNRFAEAGSLRVFGAAGVTENVVSLRLPRVSMGASAQEKVSAAVLDLGIINETAGFEQAGILGGNFLRNYRITFDFRRSLVTLEPTKREPAINQLDKVSLGETLPKP